MNLLDLRGIIEATMW